MHCSMIIYTNTHAHTSAQNLHALTTCNLQNHIHQHTHTQISSADGILNYLEALIVHDLPAGQHYISDSLYTFKTSQGSTYNSALLGQIRIRQVRVSGAMCSRVHQSLAGKSIIRGAECYPAMENAEEEVIYTKENGTDYVIAAGLAWGSGGNSSAFSNGSYSSSSSSSRNSSVSGYLNATNTSGISNGTNFSSSGRGNTSNLTLFGGNVSTGNSSDVNISGAVVHNGSSSVNVSIDSNSSNNNNNETNNSSFNNNTGTNSRRQGNGTNSTSQSNVNASNFGPLTEGNISMFRHKSASETSHTRIQGQHAVYPASGYVVDVNPATAASTIDFLRQTRWIDVKTRAVYVEYMYYSADIDAFGDTRILFEMLPSGAVVSTVTTNAVSLNRYAGDGAAVLLRVATIVFVYLTVIYYILDDLDQCRLVGLAKYRCVVVVFCVYCMYVCLSAGLWCLQSICVYLCCSACVVCLYGYIRM
jgi:hypothetical protein